MARESKLTKTIAANSRQNQCGRAKVSKHIPVLDGIRAYAVLMVCVLHFFQINEKSMYVDNEHLGIILFKISQMGLRGVELFFVLSGFLITDILLESKKSTKYFFTFYVRRFLRIFPLYYFVLCIAFLFLPNFISIDQSGEAIIQNQAWLWTFTSNLSHFFFDFSWGGSSNFFSFGHFWSLCVEEHFYIIWPFIVYFSNKKWLPRIMWMIVCFSSFSVLFSYFFVDLIPILTWSTIRGAGVLSLGGLVAVYSKNDKSYFKVIRFSKRFVLPSALLFVLVNFIPRRYQFHYVATFFASALLFFQLIIISIEGNKTTEILFNHKILFFIGKISYGIYVYHGLLLPYFSQFIYPGVDSLATNGIISTIIYTFICTAISIIIAWFSWILIESPVLKLKNFFRY